MSEENEKIIINLLHSIDNRLKNIENYTNPLEGVLNNIESINKDALSQLEKINKS